MHVLTCTSGFDPSSGNCDGSSAWVEIPSYPEPVFPPLSLADGAVVSFSIIALWSLGAKFRLMVKAART